MAAGGSEVGCIVAARAAVRRANLRYVGIAAATWR